MYKAKIIKQSEIDLSKRQLLLELYKHYYDNVVSENFFKDLDEKEWVILIEGENEEVYGFSTLQIIKLQLNQIEHIYLFSGDTIMHEEVRNSPILACAFAKFMYFLINKYPNNPLHWFLISKGYRTYRFLQVYFKEYYPVYDKNIPKEKKDVLDAIATYKFGDDYHPDNQIIHYKKAKDYLKPEHAEILDGKLKNPHICFFAERNKNYKNGDELACITDITEDNFKPLVFRIKDYVEVSSEGFAFQN